ncbi:hypothetical protein KY290_027479 [Solanum tuberosum]|uniref:RNA polymerase II subunit A C-terminal domain phosphatase SSU72 n=1 Tax=Solanum tuberosum TaxID=4113 RepID=A0ABQ7UF88_SOLTU|nr:hypothetical protein KY290_027479 [Solanum tuberosum]
MSIKLEHGVTLSTEKAGLDVASYGTGQHVKLLGPSIREPNVYDFGTPYKQMFDNLCRKDVKLYSRNGILPMLKRNLGVKLAPERWQDNAADGPFDVPVLVSNLDIKDNHEEAAIRCHLALILCQELEATENWEDTIDDIINNFEK